MFDASGLLVVGKSCFYQVQLGDDLILLAAHVLRDGVRKAEDKGETEVALKKRIELVCLIEQTNKFSPYNYHFKILLNQVRMNSGQKAEEVAVRGGISAIGGGGDRTPSMRAKATSCT